MWESEVRNSNKRLVDHWDHCRGGIGEYHCKGGFTDVPLQQHNHRCILQEAGTQTRCQAP